MNKTIGITKAARILNRTYGGVKWLINNGKLSNTFNDKGHLRFNKTECVVLSKKLRPRRRKKVRVATKYKEKSTGYIKIYFPEHPRAFADGTIYEHWLVAEQILGRSLTKKEQVHHINRVRDDNRPENIHVYPDRRTHMIEAHNHLKEYMSKIYK